jgi:hypothetical protein
VGIDRRTRSTANFQPGKVKGEAWAGASFEWSLGCCYSAPVCAVRHFQLINPRSWRQGNERKAEADTWVPSPTRPLSLWVSMRALKVSKWWKENLCPSTYTFVFSFLFKVCFVLKKLLEIFVQKLICRKLMQTSNFVPTRTVTIMTTLWL